jgi:hypothetical protein
MHRARNVEIRDRMSGAFVQMAANSWLANFVPHLTVDNAR